MEIGLAEALALLSGFKYPTCRSSALHTLLCLLILNAESNTLYSNLILYHFHHLCLRYYLLCY